MKHCIICGEKTEKPFLAAFTHFYLWQPGMLQYLKGNIQAFGFFDGLNATIGLMCPFYDTLKNWKYRKHQLIIPRDS